jgi:hypothetical protein
MPTHKASSEISMADPTGRRSREAQVCVEGKWQVNGYASWGFEGGWGGGGLFCKTAEIRGGVTGVCLQNDPSSLSGHQI